MRQFWKVGNKKIEIYLKYNLFHSHLYIILYFILIISIILYFNSLGYCDEKSL